MVLDPGESHELSVDFTLPAQLQNEAYTEVQLRLWDPSSSQHFGDTMSVLVILDENVELDSYNDTIGDHLEEGKNEADEGCMSHEDMIANALSMVNFVD